MIMADSFNFELVSPEKLLLSSAVTSVVIPGGDGEMTVMANHAPTMTTINPGVVTVTGTDGKVEKFVVFGGFADIIPTSCTLLAEFAVAVSDVTKDMLDKRVAAAKADAELAVGEDTKQRLEAYSQNLAYLASTLAA